MRLVGTGAGLIFKGTGFYETDYKKKAGQNGKDESKGDTKTEEKKVEAGPVAEKKPSSGSDSSAPADAAKK